VGVDKTWTQSKKRRVSIYSEKKRKKTIESLIKYHYGITSVIAELGYPCRAALKLEY